MLAEMGQSFANSYVGFALAQSLRHRSAVIDLPLAAEVEARYAHMAADSLAAQRRIEAADSVPFETYRQQYLSRDLLSGAQLRSHS